MTIYVLPKFQKTELPTFDVTSSHSTLSPFLLGPVQLYSRLIAENMENGWQYAKLYAEHADKAQEPTHDYWEWARNGWANTRAVRYPMGKGARPICSLWAGERLGYIEARKRIYMPLYSQAVRFYAMAAYGLIRKAAFAGDIVIKDYDAYNHRHLGYSWDDVINDPERKMGHGFVLAMMLEGLI
jgi:hypothetical protein